MTEPTPKEIDDLVYELRQAGRDDTYSLVCAVLAKWGTPAPVGVEPVALLVRKNSWRDGQWEAAPPNYPSYGLTWANQRVYVYTTPQAGAVPMTPEQRDALWESCKYDDGEEWTVDWEQIVDAVERHHRIGIKGGQYVV